MRNQNLAVMSDIDEDNFDRAFDLLRPVISGSADVGKALTHNELEVRVPSYPTISGVLKWF